VLLGFAGVSLILRRRSRSSSLYGLMGLLSGMISATAYTAGDRARPRRRAEYRTSSTSRSAASAPGLLTTLVSGELHAHTWSVLGLLLAVGLLATVAQLMMTRAYSTGRRS